MKQHGASVEPGTDGSSISCDLGCRRMAAKLVVMDMGGGEARLGFCLGHTVSAVPKELLGNLDKELPVKTEGR